MAGTIGLFASTGAVGSTFEDGVREIDDQVARLAAVRDAAGPRSSSTPGSTNTCAAATTSTRWSRGRTASWRRADGIFVPGVADPATIEGLVATIPAPLNVLVGPGAPTAPQLARLGVARVSRGSGVASAAYAVMRKAARVALSAGTYAALADEIPYSELNSLL